MSSDAKMRDVLERWSRSSVDMKVNQISFAVCTAFQPALPAHLLNDVLLRGSDINSEILQGSRCPAISLIKHPQHQVLWFELLMCEGLAMPTRTPQCSVHRRPVSMRRVLRRRANPGDVCTKGAQRQPGALQWP